MGIYTAHDLSKYIIWQHQTEEMEITNLRLQKILYYAQGYFLKKFNEPAFSEEIAHWAYGPVVVDVYFEYCSNGSENISAPNDNEFDAINSKLLPNHRRLLDKILGSTRGMSAGTLVSMTHNETPWKNTVNKSIISIDSIEEYFKNNDPLYIS